MPVDADQETLRASLAAIITHGMVPFSVAEFGGDLLQLRIVQARMPSGIKRSDDAAYEEAATTALTAVLSEVVEKIPSRKYRVVLRHVLPLIPELLGTDITERRVEAGRALRNGGKPLKAGSVRTYYEGKAVSQLAADLVDAEQSA